MITEKQHRKLIDYNKLSTELLRSENEIRKKIRKE